MPLKEAATKKAIRKAKVPKRERERKKRKKEREGEMKETREKYFVSVCENQKALRRVVLIGLRFILSSIIQPMFKLTHKTPRRKEGEGRITNIRKLTFSMSAMIQGPVPAPPWLSPPLALPKYTASIVPAPSSWLSTCQLGGCASEWVGERVGGWVGAWMGAWMGGCWWVWVSEIKEDPPTAPAPGKCAGT